MVRKEKGATGVLALVQIRRFSSRFTDVATSYGPLFGNSNHHS